MFNRTLYKDIAKKQLAGRYTTPVLATLSIMAIFALLSGSFFADQVQRLKNLPDIGSFMRTANGFSLNIHFPSLIKHTSLMIWLISVFIQGIILIAYSYLFVVLSHTTEAQGFTVFTHGCTLWLQGFTALLLRRIFVFLWGLLLIVPGIVAYYSYSHVFFILCEYPQIGIKGAFKISKEITRGHKMDLFVMDLSFLGWTLLSYLTCGIVELWLMPYKTMSYTNAYHALLDEAVLRGSISMKDLQ